MIDCIGHLRSVSDNIRKHSIRFAGHRWRVENEIVSKIQGRASRRRQTKTCIKQICDDINCSPSGLLNIELDDDTESWESMQVVQPVDHDDSF